MHGYPPTDLRCSRAHLRAGFTLVEMLVVMAVIALLAYLAFGAARSAIRSSQTAGSLSNMRQLTGALLAFSADNNNKLPDYRNPGGPFAYSWDLQIFPYLGIQNGYSGAELSPQLKQELDLQVFRCPLDSRQMSPERAFYPRSYGMTASAVFMDPFDGGIPGRRRGEGMRLPFVAKPSQYVILTRVVKERETEAAANYVGRIAGSLSNGPDPASDTQWEQYRPLFGGKIPYGFADGHVSLLDRPQALLVRPSTWKANN